MPYRTALLAAAASLLAQQPANIRTTVHLVLIPTAVTDSAGKSVEGLDSTDFEVLVDGRPMAHQLEEVTQPLSIVVAVSTDRNSGPALAKVIKSAAMIQPLLAGERAAAAVLGFADSVKVMQPFTSDYDSIVQAFRAMRPGGEGVALLDAVDEGARLLDERPLKSRRVLLLIGQSRDHGSSAKLADVLDHVQRANISVYALANSPFLTTFTVRSNERIGDPNDESKSVPAYEPGRQLDIGALLRGAANLGKVSTAKALADFTGGMAQSFVKQNALEEVLQKASLDLHSHYLLSIVAPADPEGRFHALQVRVKRPGLAIRARAGFVGRTVAEP